METEDYNSPTVSVILPFYNAPFLKDAVDSILNQTHHDFELILVDNNSTDKSSDVARTFENHPRVVLIRESRNGVVHAMNAGIEKAKGSFVARMDADDIASENRIEVQLNEFKANQALGVVSGLIEYLGPEENEGFMHYINWLNSIRSSSEIRLNQFVEFPISNPSMMFKKSLFSKYGKYLDGDFPEDYEFFLRLQAENVLMEKTDNVILKWRDSDHRLTRTDPRYAQDAFFRIKAKYLAGWLKQNTPFYPKVYIWGAGRVSRRRSDYLLDHGVEVEQYIDVKKGGEILYYEDIPDKESCFIVSYVANRGARDEIRDFLNVRQFEEGIHYILAS